MLISGKQGQCAGVKVPAIRYDEEIGLLPAFERSVGNQRLYTPRARERLTFNRDTRVLGFSLSATRDLPGLSKRPDQSSDLVLVMESAQPQAVRARIVQAAALKAGLQRTVAQNADGHRGNCHAIEVLGTFSQGENSHRATPRAMV